MKIDIQYTSLILLDSTDIVTYVYQGDMCENVAGKLSCSNWKQEVTHMSSDRIRGWKKKMWHNHMMDYYGLWKSYKNKWTVNMQQQRQSLRNVIVREKTNLRRL